MAYTALTIRAEPTIHYTNSQGMYYEYLTDRHALRFGNQILISQTYKYNRPLHYVETVIFTVDPYRYVGYSGYAPTQVNASRVHLAMSLLQKLRFINLKPRPGWSIRGRPGPIWKLSQPRF